PRRGGSSSQGSGLRPRAPWTMRAVLFTGLHHARAADVDGARGPVDAAARGDFQVEGAPIAPARDLAREQPAMAAKVVATSPSSFSGVRSARIRFPGAIAPAAACSSRARWEWPRG